LLDSEGWLLLQNSEKFFLRSYHFLINVFGGIKNMHLAVNTTLKMEKLMQSEVDTSVGRNR